MQVLQWCFERATSQGDRSRLLAKAKASYEEALTILQAVRGKDHPDVADVLTNLSRVLQEEGRVNEAASLYEKARTIQEAALGDNQTPRSRAALAALFDVVRSRTAIHAATRVPPDCVRARA